MSTSFEPVWVAVNVALRITVPCTAALVLAFHVLPDVSTHGGVNTGGPPLGVPPQRSRYPTFGVDDDLPVPSTSAAESTAAFGIPTV